MTVHLKGMTWDHPRGYQPLAACSALYEAEADVKISWDRRSLKDFGDQPLNALTVAYDLLVIDHPHVGMAAETGELLPLDEHIPEGTLRTLSAQSAGLSHESYRYNGHQWALALDAAMQCAVYREDMLAGDRVPYTWDAIIELGKKLRGEGKYVAMPLAPTDAICSFISFCAGLGVPVGMDDTLITAEVGTRALEKLREITEVAHPSSLDWNPIHMLDHMSSADDVVFCPATFNYTNYSRDGYAPKLLTFTMYPGIVGAILGGTGFAVSANSAHIDEACAFGAWVCSAPVQKGPYVAEGGQPGNIEAWNDPAANALTNNFFNNTMPSLEAAIVRPRHPGFVVFQEGAGHIIHDFLRNGTDIEACLASLRALYDAHK